MIHSGENGDDDALAFDYTQPTAGPRLYTYKVPFGDGFFDEIDVYAEDQAEGLERATFVCSVVYGPDAILGDQMGPGGTGGCVTIY